MNNDILSSLFSAPFLRTSENVSLFSPSLLIMISISLLDVLTNTSVRLQSDYKHFLLDNHNLQSHIPIMRQLTEILISNMEDNNNGDDGDNDENNNNNDKMNNNHTLITSLNRHVYIIKAEISCSHYDTALGYKPRFPN